jgi:type I restriction-modification system DNA methylase subunit
MTTFQSASRLTIAPDDRVEQLRQKLGYPVQQRDPQGSDFFYLRPGADVEEAEDTCPIAVGFYSELNGATDERSLQQLLTSSEWQQRIYGHYLSRTAEQQPVMYILMPTEAGTGQVPLILPTEGGLRQRNIQTFAWGSAELETRLNRLRQEELPVASRALTSVPLVERAFYKPIQTAKELAQLLATAARRIEQILPEVYQDEKRRYLASKGEEGYLHKLLKSFQQELLPSLQLVSENEKDYSFSDIYAQTIAYSLFTARVFGYVRDREAGQKEALFDRQSAWQHLPETNPFLRKLFQDVSERSPEELGDELISAIADIFAILRAAKMDVILQDFRQKQNREDIVIRFYEDFLAAYKPQMRERRGVYYTPEPVVSYMVRSVDVLLKEKFNKPLGLADPEVMILDPTCGTGTYLLSICQIIHDRFYAERSAIIAQVGDISWSEYVGQHLLPRIFGFELLMAPYAIAHLKVGLFLEETGYKFDGGERLKVYLANTLDEPTEKTEFLFESFVSEEANQAAEIKRDLPIRVVIGNPPYSANSANNSGWISDSVRSSYYPKDGIKEHNPKLLLDDYVKFIRFAQWRIEQTQQGILSFITNHGYLDNPTFRGMRRSIEQTFDEIYVMDLHGNSKKKETTPDGAKDENVFDIQQGVAIGLMLKLPLQA